MQLFKDPASLKLEIQHILCCVFGLGFFVLCTLCCQCLDCPTLLAPSVFSNVFFLFNVELIFLYPDRYFEQNITVNDFTCYPVPTLKV